MLALETADAPAFKLLIGQSFLLRQDDGGIPLQLTEVRLLGHRRSDAGRDPFALTFLGPPGIRLPQGTYPLENGASSVAGIFITQVGNGPTASEFEAVFT